MSSHLSSFPLSPAFLQVPLPDVRGREMILRTHAKIVKLAKDEDLWTIARVGVHHSDDHAALSSHWYTSCPFLVLLTLLLVFLITGYGRL